jgi:hypothetical protein
LIVRNVAVRLASTAARQSSSLISSSGSGRVAAGVRDQDVDRAVDVFDPFSHRFDLLVAGEVGNERRRVSSRLAHDQHGRLIAIETNGTRWVVRGNCITSSSSDDPGRFVFLGYSTGRPNTVTAPRRTNRDWLPAHRGGLLQ